MVGKRSLWSRAYSTESRETDVPPGRETGTRGDRRPSHQHRDAAAQEHSGNRNQAWIPPTWQIASHHDGPRRTRTDQPKNIVPGLTYAFCGQVLQRD